MINREDMLELTRRMTPDRTCFNRVAGAYMTAEGQIDDTFNIHFLKLSGAEMKRNLELAKAVPFGGRTISLRSMSYRRSRKERIAFFSFLMRSKPAG